VGVVSFLYEVTNIVAHHKEAAAFYADLFGLDQSRFCPIRSSEYGYDGTLTLFDPPTRLDRIELTQTDDSAYTMGRFYRKHGESIYMCYMEAPDAGEIARRIEGAGRKWVGRRESGSLNGLFIPPASLHGMLMGISRTSYAWTWSGHPELVETSS
jgi:hypothetical protein